MITIDVDSMATWVLEYELQAVINALGLVREISGWWKNHQNAATIVTKLLDTPGIVYAGNKDHTYQCTALAIAASARMANDGEADEQQIAEELAFGASGAPARAVVVVVACASAESC